MRLVLRWVSLEAAGGGCTPGAAGEDARRTAAGTAALRSRRGFSFWGIHLMNV